MAKKRMIRRRYQEGVTPSDTTARIEKPIIPLKPIKRKKDEIYSQNLRYVPETRTILERKSSDELRSQRQGMDKLYSLQHLWGGLGGPSSRMDVPLHYNREKGNVLAASEAFVVETAAGLAGRLYNGLRKVGRSAGPNKSVPIESTKKDIGFVYEPTEIGKNRRLDVEGQRSWLSNWNKKRTGKYEDIMSEYALPGAPENLAKEEAKVMQHTAKSNASKTPVYDLNNVLDRHNYYNFASENLGVSGDNAFHAMIQDLESKGTLGVFNKANKKRAIPILSNGNNSTVLHELTHAQESNLVHDKIGKITKGKSSLPDSYLDDPAEIYARINQQRKDLHDLGLIDPSKDVTLNDLVKFKEATKNTPNRNLFNRFDDNTMLELFNKVPAVAGAAGVGAAALSVDEYNEGKTSTMKKRTIKKNKMPAYQFGTTPAGLAQTNISNIGSNIGLPVGGTGKAASALNIGGIASGAMGALSSQMGVWGNAEIQQAPEVTLSKGPIQYQKSGYVNMESELKNLSKQNTAGTLGSAASGAQLGSTVGSIAGPIGGAIGGVAGAVGGLVSGIFGGKRKKRQLKRKISEANKQISAANQFNLSEAHTGMLQQEYLGEYGDTQSDVLYNKGKSKCNTGRTANALVGNGETIVDGNTGELEEVTQGRGVGVDDVPANILPQDAIAGNLTNPRTGNTFAEDMKPLTRMEKKIKRNVDRNIQSIAKNTEDLTMAYTRPLSQQILADQAGVHRSRGIMPTEEYEEGKSGIHIKPSKRGTFTAAAKRHGAGVQEFAGRVLANKESYSPAMVKKANFARNFGGRHNEGKSGIHIKPENRGKFTASANRAGMGVQAFANKVLSAPEGEYSPTLRKRANFARNAKKFKHDDGKSAYEEYADRKAAKTRGWNAVGGAVGGIGEAVTTLAPSLYNLFQGQQEQATVRPEQLYSPNARAQQSLNMMASRRYNVQPELRQLRDLERRQRYNARQMGSEAGINRAMDVAGGLNLNRAISDVYGAKQRADLQYRGEEAQMMGQLGAQEAAGRTQAMGSAYDINARNIAARKAYTGAGLTGISDYAQSQKRLRNQQSMDAMRQRALEKFLQLQTTGANIADIFG